MHTSLLNRVFPWAFVFRFQQIIRRQFTSIKTQILRPPRYP